MVVVCGPCRGLLALSLWVRQWPTDEQNATLLAEQKSKSTKPKDALCGDVPKCLLCKLNWFEDCDGLVPFIASTARGRMRDASGQATSTGTLHPQATSILAMSIAIYLISYRRASYRRASYRRVSHKRAFHRRVPHRRVSLTGVHLTDVHLIGVYLISVHLL
jgi:hypothetical protein